MPFLDVSNVLLDPDFTDTFSVLRREQVIGENGRVSTTNTTLPAIGVFTVAGPNDLERLDDNQRMGQNFVLVTKFRLQGPAKISGNNYQPDQVVWNGNTYVVKDVEPYTRYGAGQIQAIIGAIASVGAPD
jgi:galactose-6-phosphate isomerase